MPAATVKFGAFELDPANFQLRRAGLAVRLERIPMELLLLLVERRGRLVSRGEIIERIWGSNVFLDTDNAISTAVRKVRRVLGDDPLHPTYIETASGKGYRFIALARARQLQGSVPAARPAMLAVLPLDDWSDDSPGEYFSDGMTEEIITQLGRLHPGLGVIARTSVMKYKSTRKSIRRIGRELGVNYVMEGSLRRHGGRLRISVQLIETQKQTHVWAESYECPFDDILRLQDRLAKKIAGQIRSQLKTEAAAAACPATAVTPAAYEAYLKGRYFWNRKTEDAANKSIECFRDSIKRQPAFAPAYAGLADAYIFLGIHGFRPSDEVYPQAESAARAALALHDKLAEAHTSLADVLKGYRWDWPAAEAEYRRAIELNPSYAVARHWYSEYLWSLGRHEEAIREIHKAPLEQLTKTSQKRYVSPLDIAVVYVGLGDKDAAFEWLDRA